MTTIVTKYSDIKEGDSLFYKENGHERRKLNFNEIEVVKSAESYLSKGNGILVQITFESGNKTLGFPDRTLEKIIN